MSINYETESFFSNNQNIFTQITNDGDGVEHSHSFYEFFYITSGSLEHVCNNNVERISVGNFGIIKPGVSHKFIRLKENEAAHRDILIHPRLLDECCRFLKINIDSYTDSIILGRISTEEINIFENEFNNLIFNKINDSDFNSTWEKTLCIDVIKKIISMHKKNTSHFPLWFNQLLSSFSSIDTIKVGLDAILRHIHYDKSYVCRTFKKITGMTMSEYLLKTRLSYASTLLQTTKQSVTEIALNTGFSSIAYFNKKFKEQFGITPSQFRHQ